MLIRLIPLPPAPTVLFTLSFPSVLSHSLNPSLSWSLLLQRLSHLQQLTSSSFDYLQQIPSDSADSDHPHLESLPDRPLDPLPDSWHALDKSAWVTCILQEVTFDLCEETVGVVFVDGERCEWPMLCGGGGGRGIVGALQSVLEDVNLSAEESEKERAAASAISACPASNTRPTKHKKQRSLLMSLVASLVPHPRVASAPRTPSPPPSPRVPSSLPPRNSLARHPNPNHTNPRLLRRRARSTLTDTYRLYVLPEIRSRLNPGGYYTWILESMIRRTLSRFRQLEERRGLMSVSSAGGGTQSQGGWDGRRRVVSEAEGNSDEEDGDGESLETATDGSSVHTPTEGEIPDFISTPPVPPPSASENNTYFSEPVSAYDSRISVKMSSSSTRIQNSNTGRCHHKRSYDPLPDPLPHLTHLLSSHVSLQRSVAAEHEHVLAILEVKSRRRAWSNGARMSLSRGQGDLGYGLGMPVRSSPLARCVPIVVADFECEWDEYEGEGDGEGVGEGEGDGKIVFGVEMEMGMGRGAGRLEVVSRESDLCLFPSGEGDDDDEEDDGDADVSLSRYCQPPRPPHISYRATPTPPKRPADFGFSSGGHADEEDGDVLDHLEAGFGFIPRAVEVCGPRRRTTSMIVRAGHLPLDQPPVAPGEPSEKLTSDSLLCQPLARLHGEGEGEAGKKLREDQAWLDMSGVGLECR